MQRSAVHTLSGARHREVERAQDEEGDFVGHEQVDHREEHGREQCHAAEQHPQQPVERDRVHVEQRR